MSRTHQSFRMGSRIFLHAHLLACGITLLMPIPSSDAAEPTVPAEERVALLHGLARTSASMSRMAETLGAAGYRVCNVSYASRHHPVEELAADFVAPAIERCFPEPGAPIHFVTHSLGGIVVRQLAAANLVESFGRIVMLSPPNRGSEIVDYLGSWWLFEWVNGPAGLQLGTSASSLPVMLGPARFDVGVISGRRSINLGLSMLIPGPDDGKVSVARAELDGMDDFLVVPASHPFIMRDADVIRQTLHFLRMGRFDHGPS